jgi:hypothetical protein
MGNVSLLAGNRQNAKVANGGVIAIRLPTGPAGSDGAPGDPGPPGPPMPKVFLATDYGAVGGGADDTTAILDALAAAAASGGTVYLTDVHGWTGTIVVPDGVGIDSLASNKAGAVPRLKALDSTSKLRIGEFATGTGRLGAIRNLEVDGNSTGDVAGLVVIQTVLTHFENLRVHDSAGVGILIDGAQNSTFLSCVSITHGTNCLVIDKGAGGLAFYRCSISGGAQRSLLVTQSGASGGGAYPFSPAHISFDHCILENNINCTSLVDVAAGNLIRFKDCGISINNASTVSSGYLVRILNNPTYGTIASHAEFDSCQLFGGTSSQASGFYIQGTNLITADGHAFAQNTPNLFSTDGASAGEDLGVWQTTNVTSRYHALSGGSFDGWTRRTVRKARPAITVNSTGQTVDLDVQAYKYFPILLNGATVSIGTLNLNNAVGGEEITLFIAQTAGGATITWPSSINFATGDPLNLAALSVTVVHLRYNASTSKWDEMGRAVSGSSDAEYIRDVIGAALVAGSGATVTVNDAGDTITIALDNTVEDERIRDVIGTALVAGSGVTITVNDAGDTITIAASGGGTTIPKNTQTGTTYTAVLADAGKCIEMNNASPNVLRIPPGVFPLDTVLQWCQLGAGQTTVAPGSGVTLHQASSLTTRAQFSTGTARQRATDEWIIGGDMT